MSEVQRQTPHHLKNASQLTVLPRYQVFGSLRHRAGEKAPWKPSALALPKTADPLILEVLPKLSSFLILNITLNRDFCLSKGSQEVCFDPLCCLWAYSLEKLLEEIGSPVFQMIRWICDEREHVAPWPLAHERNSYKDYKWALGHMVCRLIVGI